MQKNANCMSDVLLCVMQVVNARHTFTLEIPERERWQHELTGKKMRKPVSTGEKRKDC